MLFGVNLSRGCGRVKRRRPDPKRSWKIAATVLVAGIFTALLFLAPQWLLVVLVLILTGAIIAAVCFVKQ